MGIMRSVVMLLAMVALAIYMALRPRGPEVLGVTMATALDDTFRAVAAVETYAPDDTFFASVELRGYRPEMELMARWRYGEQVIKETRLATGQTGDGYAGFVLNPEQPPQWPEGEYRVEIVYEDKVLGSAAFRVEG
jgi:hypothetical protein